MNRFCTNGFRRNRFVCSFFVALVCVWCNFLNTAPMLAQSTPFLTYTTPPQPLHVQVNGSEIHVLCGQVDNNFNGTLDVGDVPASWVVLNANASATLRSRQFLWNEGVGFPSRPAWDFTTNTLYLAQSGRIRSFDTGTLAVKRDTVLLIDTLARSTFGTTGTVSALSINSQDFSDMGVVSNLLLKNSLMISLRGKSTSAVIELELSSDKIISRSGGGIFVQQSYVFEGILDNKQWITLNEGSFGSSNATLTFFDNIRGSTTLKIGDTGNHIFLFFKTAIVTMNGSHEVHFINLNNQSVVKTIPTGTTGFNGPRESVLIGNTLYTTTYASDVRAFDITTGREVARYNPRGKPEGIAALGNSIVVANAFEAGGFASANTVVVLNAATTSVKEQPLQAEVSCSPNPVIDRTTLRVEGIDTLQKDVSLTLVNALGQQVARLTPHYASRSSLEAEIFPAELGLSQGTYFVHLRSAQGVKAIPVRVVR